ncbi:MAG: hypothetical protein AB1567_03095 [bacterium]
MGEYGTLTTLPPNVTSYRDTDVIQKFTYYYRIRVRNGCGYSTYSTVASATTSSGGFPNQPANPIPANGTTNQPINPTLGWTGGDNDGDDVNYTICFGTNTTPGTIGLTGTNTTNYTPATLTNNTWYYWKIVAVDEHGSCTVGTIWSFKTIDNKPPGTPTNITAKAKDWNQVEISWNDIYDDELGFIIYSKNGATEVYGTVATVGPNVTSYINSGLNENTVYYYRISVYDGFGNSGYSQEISVTTPLKSQFALYNNLFNPTKDGPVIIKYRLLQSASVKIKIYALDGVLVKTIVDDYKSADLYTEFWDGRDEDGEIVASGIYLVYFDCGYLKEIKKVAVIK